MSLDINFNRYYLLCKDTLYTQHRLISQVGLKFSLFEEKIYVEYLGKKINISFSEFKFLILKQFNNDTKTITLFFALRQ